MVADLVSERDNLPLFQSMVMGEINFDYDQYHTSSISFHVGFNVVMIWTEFHREKVLFRKSCKKGA